jgi:ATP-dependent DNA helicase DinG
MHYVVPAAALHLKQGFGRLIRTRADRGIVALLDERVSTKGYGKVFLRSLPPAQRCSSLAEVSAFWRNDLRTRGAEPELADGVSLQMPAHDRGEHD